MVFRPRYQLILKIIHMQEVHMRKSQVYEEPPYHVYYLHTVTCFDFAVYITDSVHVPCLRPVLGTGISHPIHQTCCVLLPGHQCQYGWVQSVRLLHWRSETCQCLYSLGRVISGALVSECYRGIALIFMHKGSEHMKLVKHWHNNVVTHASIYMSSRWHKSYVSILTFVTQ